MAQRRTIIVGPGNCSHGEKVSGCILGVGLELEGPRSKGGDGIGCRVVGACIVRRLGSTQSGG
jgi:hypothetical protein